MKASILKKISITSLLIICSLAQVQAREKITVSGGLETYIAYMWRGQKVCGANIAPNLTLKWGGFALQSFGYVSFDGSYKEIDWDLSYSVGDFSFHLADYYAHLSSWTTPENYFCFKKGHTNHIQEAIICYEPQKLPFAFRWFTFLRGDWLPGPDGTLGRPSFSSYLEAEVFYDFSESSRLSLLGGASVLKGSSTGYTKDFSVINIELRYAYSIPIKAVKIPLIVSFITNPYSKKAWVNAGAGIRF